MSGETVEVKILQCPSGERCVAVDGIPVDAEACAGPCTFVAAASVDREALLTALAKVNALGRTTS